MMSEMNIEKGRNKPAYLISTGKSPAEAEPLMSPFLLPACHPVVDRQLRPEPA